MWKYGSLVHFDPPLNPLLVNKNKLNKHINRCDEQCHDCITGIRILSITLDCFIRVYWDIMFSKLDWFWKPMKPPRIAPVCMP